MDAVVTGSTIGEIVSSLAVVSAETDMVDFEARSGSKSSTSFFVILPPGPDPAILERVIPRSSAMRRAIGVANIRPVAGSLETCVVSWNCSGSLLGPGSSILESTVAVV